MYVIKQNNETFKYLRSFDYSIDVDGMPEFKAGFSGNLELAKTFKECQKSEAENLLKAMKLLSKNDLCEELYLARLENVNIIVDEARQVFLKSMNISSGTIETNWTPDKSLAMKFTKDEALQGVLKTLESFESLKNFKALYI